MSKLRRFFVLCLSVGLLTGCGLTANKDSNHIFTYAMGEKWQTLDSSKANDRTSYTLIHTFMEGLYEYKRNDDGILKPKADLVKKLKHSDDMKVYTIQLRKINRCDDRISHVMLVLFCYMQSKAWFRIYTSNLGSTNEIFP